MQAQEHAEAKPTNEATPTQSLDLDAIRADFPVLSQAMRGKPVAFLDSAASSQRPLQVIEAMDRVQRLHYANVHRGVYEFSQKCTDLYEEARRKVQAFLNAPEDRECIFVRGTTEAVNLVARSWGGKNLEAGDTVLITAMEHHSNIVPWQMIAEERGAKVDAVPIDRRGVLDLEVLKEKLAQKPKLLALAHVSNVLGTINPIAEICRLAHQQGTLVFVDGAQAVPHMPVDVQALGCDFYAFSAHKMFGPSGIGVLWGRAELLSAMPPFQGGGSMIDEVRLDGSTYAEIPMRFEAGTPAIVEVVGLGAAIDYLEGLGMEAVAQAEHELLVYGTEILSAIPEVEIYGSAPDKASVISFNVKGIHPHDLGTILDQSGVAIRTGHHCAQPLMQFFEVPATARASLAVYNRREDLDRLVEAIQKALELFA